MLCQNCQVNDAAVHLKQIINGEAREVHLCAECAAAMGYSDMLGIFQIPFGMLLGAAGGKIRGASAMSEQRCPTCGFSFEDISRTGRPGCPDCYRVFFDRLAPSVRKIHGKTVHVGKIPLSAEKDDKNERRIRELTEELKKAVSQQNFERAAFLRDEIKSLSEKGAED